MENKRILVLGCKEYPMGSSGDPIPSGGIEIYIERLVKILPYEFLIMTRGRGILLKKKKVGRIWDAIEVVYLPYIKGLYTRNLSFNTIAFIVSFFYDYDLILTNGIVASFYGFILSRIKRKKFISIPHGLVHTEKQYNNIIKKILYLFQSFVYSKPDYLVFLIETEREIFKKTYGLKCKSVIIPTGIDTSYFYPDKQESGRISIISNSRLIARKNVDWIVRLAWKLENIDFWIYNDGIESANLRIQAPPNVKFFGVVEKEEMHNAIRKADIYILASDIEGLPIALLEAMSAGCCCIIHSTLKLPLLALTFNDEEGMYKIVQHMLTHNFRTYGRLQRRFVERNFSIKQMRKKYISLLEEAIK